MSVRSVVAGVGSALPRRRVDNAELAEQVEAGELDGGGDLGSVVVERRRRVGDEEAHLFEARGVASDHVVLQRANGGDGRLAPAAHFAQADQPVIGFDFDDGANEAAPVAPVRVTKWRFERDGDGCRAKVGDLHASEA